MFVVNKSVNRSLYIFHKFIIFLLYCIIIKIINIRTIIFHFFRSKEQTIAGIRLFHACLRRFLKIYQVGVDCKV
jgi:uncharacterized integral membrane protein